jgi:hypothetical protein
VSFEVIYIAQKLVYYLLSNMENNNLPIQNTLT